MDKYVDVMYKFRSPLFIALVVRLLAILFGVFLDNLSVGGLSYTDIDYFVFTDAAKLVSMGYSPYERATYRYPPIIASILSWCCSFSIFGKLIFSIADAAIVYQIQTILTLTSSREIGVWWAWFWALNPASIMICTRGSADSLVNWLVLLTVYFVIKGNAFAAGLVHGAAVHVRLYPVIYLPAFVVHLAASTATGERRAANKQEAVHENAVKSTRSSRLWLCALFLVGCCFALGVSTALSAHYFGSPYLEHSLLYHLTRSDHRHNFSMHFYWIYLSSGADSVLQGTDSSDWSLWLSTTASATVNACGQLPLCNVVYMVTAKSILFAPQMLLLSLLAWAFAQRHLAACLLLQTAVFVSCNKVVTAQYFTWALCLLPIAAPSLRRVPIRLAVWCCVAWTGSLAAWLCSAYLLEFRGQNVFEMVWACSVLFHVANTACIALLICYVQ